MVWLSITLFVDKTDSCWCHHLLVLLFLARKSVCVQLLEFADTFGRLLKPIHDYLSNIFFLVLFFVMQPFLFHKSLASFFLLGLEDWSDMGLYLWSILNFDFKFCNVCFWTYMVTTDSIFLRDQLMSDGVDSIVAIKHPQRHFAVHVLRTAAQYLHKLDWSRRFSRKSFSKIKVFQRKWLLVILNFDQHEYDCPVFRAQTIARSSLSCLKYSCSASFNVLKQKATGLLPVSSAIVGTSSTLASDASADSTEWQKKNFARCRTGKQEGLYLSGSKGFGSNSVHW